MKRRYFLPTAVAGISSLSFSGISTSNSPSEFRKHSLLSESGKKLKPQLCLNAYSFNKSLLNGELSLEELFRFAVATGFVGVDLTAYYIPQYPSVPSDEILFDIKKMAFRYGIGITGTGVRNDFTLADPEDRAQEVDLVKNWIIAAAKLGAPHVRVFASRSSQQPAGYSREQTMSWVIEACQSCADFGEQHGVMVAFQNHDDFIVHPPDILNLLTSVSSDWFGLMLDIGSLPEADPYQAIEQLIPYAISWQVKENIKTNTGTQPTDFKRLMEIVVRKGYEGYFPLETLGKGDPFEKVSRLYQQVNSYL